MPVITETPITRVYNQWYILNFNVDIKERRIIIQYAKICIEDEEILIAPGSISIAQIVGSEFLDLATSLADGTKSMYDNIKEKLYTYLLTKGLIEGTIS